MFGDRVTAVEKYESMIQVLGKGVESRPYVNLARRQKAQIESAGDGKPDRLKIVADALQQAKVMYHEGKVVEARKIWNSIVSLYGNNRELKPQVREARSNLVKGVKEDSDSEPVAEEPPRNGE